jgi:hypothetical protein
MPDEQKSKAQAPPESMVDLGKIRMEEPEDGVIEAYANVVNLNWTLYDVRIRFAELIQVPDDDRPNWENQHGIVLERAAVTIPWHQAKALSVLLSGIVKHYEEINGELKPVKLPAPVPIPPKT